MAGAVLRKGRQPLRYRFPKVETQPPEQGPTPTTPPTPSSKLTSNTPSFPNSSPLDAFTELSLPDDEESHHQVDIGILSLSCHRYIDKQENVGKQDPLFVGGRPRKFLGRITSWRMVAMVNTDEICEWFDIQRNDYNKHSSECGTSVNLRYIGHPGSSPQDIRARPFLIRWNDDVITADRKQEAIKKRRVIYRAIYVCAGRHNQVPKDEDHDDNGDDDAPEDEFDGDGEDHGVTVKALGRGARWRRCGGPKLQSVALAIEVSADDIVRAKIWQSGEHDDAHPSTLAFSRRMKSIIEEQLSLHGSRASQVQKMILKTYQTRNPMYKVPVYRHPTRKHIRAMLPASRRQQQLLWHPFASVKLLVIRNPDKFYMVTDFDPNVDPKHSRFTCAMKDDFTMDCLIRHSRERGMFIDSSYRKKNESRAAMTIIAVVNEHMHATPGAVLLSAKTDTQTYLNFIKATIEQVEHRCKALVAGIIT
ncbi:hypothetical protein FRC03_009846 [Tulasnella sp. 419]|nr:hypothetical protein FRC03_009846 [Tulasnella sp. 419]